jgi:hypothetical protein
MTSSAVPQGSFVLAWTGEDPALHSALLEQLDAAGIPYSDKRLGDDAVAPTADPLPVYWNPRFGFEVAVLSTDFPAAREIVEKLLAAEPVDMELPAAEGAADTSVAETPPARDDGIPSVEVWSGDHASLRKFLVDALHESEIPLRIEAAGTRALLFVPPKFEARAREIIREVTEAAPPK